MKKKLSSILAIFMVTFLFACGGGGSGSGGSIGGGNNNSALAVNAYVTGRVIDSAGIGLSGAKVEMMDSYEHIFWSVTTDASGNFTDEGRLMVSGPTSGTIIVTKAGFSPDALIFSISPGETHPPVEIILGTGGSGGTEIGRIHLSGIIKLSDGGIAEGASVLISRITEKGFLVDVFSTRADVDGNFTDEGAIVVSKTAEYNVCVFYSEKYSSATISFMMSPGGTYNLGIITLEVLP